MELFHEDGHLTKAAIARLAAGEELPETARLEIAEHLSYCDCCLQRYTAALAEPELLTPERSCQERLWRRVRARAVRLITSRYATAAAAVAVALTLVWSGSGSAAIQRPPQQEQPPAVTERLQRWNRAMDGVMSEVDEFLNGLNSLTRR